MKISGGSVDLFSFTGILRKLLLGFALCITFNLAAQEDGATIYHLEGRSFALTVRGERSVISAETLRDGGINLERSGIVHTGAGTFLEIQLIPSRTVIKMAENTSLVYNGIDTTGGFVDLGLLYGRIRVVVGDGMGAGPVVIRSGGISSRTEAGDLGADYILEPGNRNAIPRPLFRIHAFRGSAELFPYGRGGPQPYFGSAQTMRTEEGESLTLDISSSHTFAEKKPISHETLSYWMLYNFAGFSPLPMPITGIMPAPVEEVELALEPAPLPQQPQPSPPLPVEASTIVIPFEQQEETTPHLPTVTNNRTKNVCLALGLVLTFAAAATQGITYHMYDINTNRTANNIFTAAQIPLGVGILTTLGGILYNPSPGKSGKR